MKVQFASHSFQVRTRRNSTVRPIPAQGTDIRLEVSLCHYTAFGNGCTEGKCYHDLRFEALGFSFAS